MLQKFLDGKKKYSAYIITVLGTLVPLLIQDPEAQQTFMDMVPSIAVLIAGIFYILTQGKIDKVKEEAKAATAQSTQELQQPQGTQQTLSTQITPETPVPFDRQGISRKRTGDCQGDIYRGKPMYHFLQG